MPDLWGFSLFPAWSDLAMILAAIIFTALLALVNGIFSLRYAVRKDCSFVGYLYAFLSGGGAVAVYWMVMRDL